MLRSAVIFLLLLRNLPAMEGWRIALVAVLLFMAVAPSTRRCVVAPFNWRFQASFYSQRSGR
jgi:hypothetical protein